MQTHRLTVADSQSIVLDWYPAASDAPVAVFVHGLGSHRRGEKACYFAERFTELGWGFAAVDLRGHGESDGSIRDLTLSRSLTDLDVTLRWLAQRHRVKPVLIGSSMGAAVSAWHALQHPDAVEALVMIAPSLAFPNRLVDEIGPEAMQAWQRHGVRRWNSEWLNVEIGYSLMEDAVRYDADRLPRELQVDMFILHGMRDDTIDWRASASFAERCRARCDLLLLKDGDHRLTVYKHFLFDALWAWLQRSKHDA